MGFRRVLFRSDLLSRLGMAAEGSGGTVDADLHFNFPLKKDLDFDDVSLQVAAAVADGAMRNVLLGQDMTAAQPQVVVDDSRLHLSGQICRAPCRERVCTYV